MTKTNDTEKLKQALDDLAELYAKEANVKMALVGELEKLKHRCRQLDAGLTETLAQIAAKDAAFAEIEKICQQYEDDDVDSMCCGLVGKVRAAYQPEEAP